VLIGLLNKSSGSFAKNIVIMLVVGADEVRTLAQRIQTSTAEFKA